MPICVYGVVTFNAPPADGSQVDKSYPKWIKVIPNGQTLCPFGMTFFFDGRDVPDSDLHQRHRPECSLTGKPQDHHQDPRVHVCGHVCVGQR